MSTMPHSGSTAPATVLTAAEEVARIAAGHAQQSERQRRLGTEVVRALISAGFARHFVPARHGGDAGTFQDVVEAVTVIGAACPSSAWGASLTASLGRMASYLPETGQKRLWATGPDTLIVGGLMPLGRIRRDGDAWLLSGAWPYVSLVDHSDWALVCAVPTDERSGARLLAIPRDAYRVEDTWAPVGMRGTGSNTLVAEDVRVPDDLTFPRDAVTEGVAPGAEAPCHRVPLKGVNGLCFAAPVVGAACGALAAWRDEAAARRTGPDGRAAVALGEASAHADTARLLLLQAARTADSGSMTDLDVARNGRDCAYAARLAVAAVDRLFTAAGTRAHQDSAVLQRYWRDAHSAVSHVVLDQEATADAYGRHLLTD
jgi:two-component flavin-dependent monooxygenase